MATTAGSCLCSSVKYTFTGPPALQAVCHCDECHKISGSAFTTNLIVPSSNFTITSGASTLKSYLAPHQSGMTLTLHFCSRCGNTIYKEADAEAFKGVVIVQAGTLDAAPGEMGLDNVKPGVELWVKQRVEWVKAFEGLGQCQEFV